MRETKDSFRLAWWLCCMLWCWVWTSHIVAQPSRGSVQVILRPNHADWQYELDEAAEVSVMCLQYGTPIPSLDVCYEIGPELQAPTLQGTLDLAESTTIHVPPCHEPGFRRVRVSLQKDGHTYSDYVTLAYRPDLIQAFTPCPPDFKSYWASQLQLANAVPLDACMERIARKCEPDVEVYHVSFVADDSMHRLYGVLAVPVGRADVQSLSSWPALLCLPGAGVRAIAANLEMARLGFVTLSLGIHGIPLDTDKQTLAQLAHDSLSNYPAIRLDSRDEYYYNKVYIGCSRAVDFLHALPMVDGTRIGVAGASQGGALAMVTAALNPRVSFLVAQYPALCDLYGDLYGRAGGWPRMLNPAGNPVPQAAEVVPYYDVVNFARMLTQPGFYSWGYNDATCSPSSIQAAYNVITAPKQDCIMLDAGHWSYPEQREAKNTWIKRQVSLPE